MKENTVLYLFLLGFLLILGSNMAHAKAEDHPVIERFPGSTLSEDDYEHQNFNSFEFYVTEGDETTTKVIKGEYWMLDYEIYNESGECDESISGVEIIENYKHAALERGGKILYDYDECLTFTIPLESGNTCWVYMEAGDGWYMLWIIEEEGLQPKLKFGEDEIKSELDKSGHIAIYGITFEIDKADLKVGAEEQLIEVVKLMRNNPSLKIEIQGHTDNTGSDAHNQTLSEARAETVKDFILLYGISSDRLQTKGFGPSQPIDSNDTEEGRARNRRVEIVKI